MRNSVAFVALSALVSLASAQTTNYTVDPSSIDLSTRSSWCAGQQNTCGTLCANDVTANNCDPTTLNYNCTCASNNSSPGLQYYQQTVPSYLCEQEFSACNSANAGNAQGQKNCTDTIEANCGKLDPNTADVSTPSSSSAAPSSTSAAASSAAPASGSASATGTAASSTSSAGAMQTAIAHYGNGAAAVAVGVFAYLL